MGTIVRVLIAIGCAAFVYLLAWGIAHDSRAVSMTTVMLLAVIVLLIILLVTSPDTLRSQATERMLSMASKTLDHMHEGLSPQSCEAVCELLLAEADAKAISMTDTTTVLAFVGEGPAVNPVGEANSAATMEVLESGKMETFVTQGGSRSAHHWDPEEEGFRDARLFKAGVIVPIIVRDETVGTIKFYYRNPRDVDRTELAIARGFGDVISTQLSAHELDEQAELAAQAEVKALQAQINPHFLFNTLNTIAALTRTDPQKARALLREFSFFYRQTLEGSQGLIPLSRELEQTRRYLMFEYARFGDDRIQESEHVEAGCEDILVPAFIVQPIVENAVRHAMREEGTLHIDLHIGSDGDDVLIAVTDDGLGMDEEHAALLLEGNRTPGTGNSKGAGIALRNVAERVERFYGKGSGVEVVSRPDEGTCVTVRLAHVSPQGASGSGQSQE